MFKEIFIVLSSILLELCSHTSLIVLLAFFSTRSIFQYIYKPVDAEDTAQPPLRVSLAPSQRYGTMVKAKPYTRLRLTLTSLTYSVFFSFICFKCN